MPGEFFAREFVDLEIHPARRTWEDLRAAPPARRRFSALLLLEACGWMQLGARSGAFPQDQLISLMDSSWGAVLEANEFAASQRLVDEHISGQNRRLITSKQFGPLFQESYKTEFNELHEAATIFFLWWGEARSFSRFHSSVALIEVINFGSEDEWQFALNSLISEPFQPEGNSVPKISLVEGYFRLLQHLDRMANLTQLDGIASRKWPARAVMRIEMADIHRWQIDFRNSVLKTRLEAATKAVEEICGRRPSRMVVALRPGASSMVSKC